MHNMIDGKITVVKSSREIHPKGRYLVASLAELFQGFTATNNPFETSMVTDAMKVWLFGPADETGVPLRVHEGPHGLYVEGLDLLIAVARLLHVGPPVWSRSVIAMADYWKALIAQCEPFQVPEPAPRTRQELEQHVEACDVCQPVAKAMALSIDAGSSAYQDADVREMVESAHEDQAAAIAHYQQKAAAHAGSTPGSKAARKKAVEVTP